MLYMYILIVIVLFVVLNLFLVVENIVCNMIFWDEFEQVKNVMKMLWEKVKI